DARRDGHATWLGQEGEYLAGLIEGVVGEIGQQRHVAAFGDEALEMIDAVLIGMRHHFMPVLAEAADVDLLVWELRDQQFLRLAPGAASILLDIPVVGTDILEEPLALG